MVVLPRPGHGGLGSFSSLGNLIRGQAQGLGELKNRSKAKPEMARKGAQKKLLNLKLFQKVFL